MFLGNDAIKFSIIAKHFIRSNYFSMSEKTNHLAYIRGKGKFLIDCDLKIFLETEISELKKYGHWFLALTNGILFPFNDEQQHFIDVALFLKPPRTIHEKIWNKYLLRKKIELKYGETLNNKPKLKEDQFYNRDMVKMVKSTMFKVIVGNKKR